MRSWQIDDRVIRVKTFVRSKMSRPEMVINCVQLLEWLLEFEEIVGTHERTWKQMLEEHMATCVKPLLYPKELFREQEKDRP